MNYLSSVPVYFVFIVSILTLLFGFFAGYLAFEFHAERQERRHEEERKKEEVRKQWMSFIKNIQGGLNE